MGGVARSDTFFIALMAWLFLPLFLGVKYFADMGAHGETALWIGLIGGIVLDIILTWQLISRVPVFRRMSNRMSSWGLGVAQLTLFAYLAVMPIYFLICLFSRRGDEY
jgi:hypothetical protein